MAYISRRRLADPTSRRFARGCDPPPQACRGRGLHAVDALARAGLLAFGSSLGWLLAVVLIDRIGKGIRSYARDAMISFSTRPSDLATAFGVDRALDTAGAMLGPLIAFGLLMRTQRAISRNKGYVRHRQHRPARGS